MPIYVVVCPFMENGYFGVYTSIMRARKAIINFCETAPEIEWYDDTGDYSYIFHTTKGEDFSMIITWGVLDEEFITPINPLED